MTLVIKITVFATSLIHTSTTTSIQAWLFDAVMINKIVKIKDFEVQLKDCSWNVLQNDCLYAIFVIFLCTADSPLPVAWTWRWMNDDVWHFYKHKTSSKDFPFYQLYIVLSNRRSDLVNGICSSLFWMHFIAEEKPWIVFSILLIFGDVA